MYKKPNLNHTEYAYREAVSRLKSMLADSYSACKSRRHGYESDDPDRDSVRKNVKYIRFHLEHFFHVHF